jgi:uncharacterized protein
MQILTDDMKRVVREQSLGFVATVCPDGTPNLSPKGTLSVWDDDHLAFVDLFSPGTMSNLRTNPAVEINVVDHVTRTGYRFKGRGDVHVAGPVFDEILAFFRLERQMDPRRVKGFAMIEVQHVAPLVSPAYDTGLTVEQVVERSLRRLEQLYGLKIVRAEGGPAPASPTPS